MRIMVILTVIRTVNKIYLVDKTITTIDDDYDGDEKQALANANVKRHRLLLRSSLSSFSSLQESFCNYVLRIRRLNAWTQTRDHRIALLFLPLGIPP